MSNKGIVSLFIGSQVDAEAQDLALNNNTLIKDKEQAAAAALAYGVKHSKVKKIRSKEPQNGIRHPHLPPQTQIHPHHPEDITTGTMPNESSGDVKCERLSPTEPGNNNNNSTTTNNNTESQQISHQNSTSHGTSPTPSHSPKSPASHRTRTPSFPGTPPNPAFTPPTNLHPGYDRFSPAALSGMTGLPGGTGPMKQMENFMNRNCSELMRSLAARYNNSNPNE